MFLNINLCSLVIFVVSPNSVIPVQTYPIYQQNGYTNPSANQPENIQTYIQGYRAENQINVLPFSIREALLNKLSTNPTGQSTLDHSITNYCPYLNGMENYQIPTNLVSNYPIGSAFYLTNDNGNVNIKNNSANSKIKKSVKQRNRKSKRKQKDNDGEIIATKEEKVFTTNVENSHVKDEAENLIKINKKSKRKKKGNRTLEESASESEHDLENIKKKRRRKNHNKSNIKDESKNAINVESKSTDIGDNLDLILIKESKGTEQRRTRNSNSKISESLKSSPRTPEEITKEYFSNLHQYSDPEISNWFNNYKNFYESLLSKQPMAKKYIRKYKRKRKSRKGKKKQQKINSQTKNVAEATTITNTDKVTNDSTTTENIMYWSEQIETNLKSDPVDVNSKLIEGNEKAIEYPSNEVLEGEYQTNECEEKYENGFYGGYIDDYYPQFFDSAAFNADNKEMILKSLNNDKYHYATEVINADLTNKYENEYDGISSHWLKDYNEIKSTYNEIEGKSKIDSDIMKEDLDTERSFRNPPFLESPDFITRHIDKSAIGSNVYYHVDDISDRFVGDKSSTYKSKSLNVVGGKCNEISEQQKTIETIYAKSKVASYGPSTTIKNTTPKIAISDTDSYEGNNYQNDGTTYVIAESLDNPDLYW